jgi:acyl carrier protein
MDESAVRGQLRSWIIKHAKNPPGTDFSDETLLLEQGILSSLDIVEFVLFIENVRGDEVDTDAIEPDAFTSINALYTAFFAAA